MSGLRSGDKSTGLAFAFYFHDAGQGLICVTAERNPTCNDVDNTIVHGVNHHTCTANDHIVSNASYATNFLTPVTKVLHKGSGIKYKLMIAVYSYINEKITNPIRNQWLNIGYWDRVRCALVSTNFNHDSHSSIFANDQTRIIQGNIIQPKPWRDLYNKPLHTAHPP